MSRWTKWTPERLERAASLWRDGFSEIEIASKLGVSRTAFSSVTCGRRHLFPMRGKPKFTLPSSLNTDMQIPADAGPPRRTYIAGKWVEHVKRTTSTGAVVTLPRVGFIDGAREGAD